MPFGRPCQQVRRSYLADASTGKVGNAPALARGRSELFCRNRETEAQEAAARLLENRIHGQ